MTELDLSYTPPLGSPWDAVQMAAQPWAKEHQLDAERATLTMKRRLMTTPTLLFVCTHHAGVGIDDSAHVPMRVTEELVRNATVVISMKPGLDRVTDLLDRASRAQCGFDLCPFTVHKHSVSGRFPIESVIRGHRRSRRIPALRA